MRATQAVRTLEENRARGFGKVATANGLRLRFPVDAGTIDSLLGYDELRARSSVEFIATKSGNRRMLAAIDEWREVHPKARITPGHWSDADVTPVMQAIDESFKELGWIR